MLHEFLSSNSEELISRCRVKVAKRHIPRATGSELEYGIPIFLTQLIEILRAERLTLNAESAPGRSETAELPMGIARTAVSHGRELLRMGFSVDQVVQDYGDLCQAVTELAIESNTAIAVNEFQTLNRCLDDAIAEAVSGFARERERVIDDAREHTVNERLSLLAEEFRSLLNTTVLAVGALKSGNIGTAGSTGAILDRCVKGLLDLCARSLVDIRLRAGLPEGRERVQVSEFIEEIRVSASIDAKACDLELIVLGNEPELAIEIDRQILAGAVANLLQNAFKFTKSHGRVWLKTSSAADRVLIQVEDECGGLPTGDAEDLFRRFEQRSSDQSGLGLGLGISRRGVEANSGKLNVCNLPGRGCRFTIDLPKSSVAADRENKIAYKRSTAARTASE